MFGDVLRSLPRACLLFTALTLVVTWPQAMHLGTQAADHYDVFFNMWRFGWFAHALVKAPASLLDGNIFHPERRTLTFSDAMPVESALAAPLLWLSVPPVLVHNLILLLGIILSGAGMFVLAREVTGSRLAGLVAGMIFSFAPYRFEHYMHMELQWTVWMPWAFWALYRAVTTGRLRFGLLTGLFLTLQMLSSIYYGVFLAALLPIAAAVLFATVREAPVRRSAAALLAGALVAAVLCGIYAAPYRETRELVGARSIDEVEQFSATPASYLAASPTNFLYGRTSDSLGGQERRLFPGALALMLAVAGLVLRPRAPVAAASLACGLLAFDLSLGPNGLLYEAVYRHVTLFHAFRAIARLGVFVLFFVALLAAHGTAVITRPLPPPRRRAAGAVLCGILLAEYWVAPLPLVAYPNEPPDIYRLLESQPFGIVAEFPLPSNVEPGDEPRIIYASTFHWKPLLNGYSGYYPPSYKHRRIRLRAFPAPHTIGRLRKEGVRYVIVHSTGYPPVELERVLASLTANPHLIELGRFSDGVGPAVLFTLRGGGTPIASTGAEVNGDR